jgi:hypothetical protein
MTSVVVENEPLLVRTRRVGQSVPHCGNIAAWRFREGGVGEVGWCVRARPEMKSPGYGNTPDQSNLG